MKVHPFALLGLVATSCFAGAAGAAEFTRGQDPWVFHTNLDGQSRRWVAALAPKFWVAYDAQAGSLAQVWDGGVNLDGAVYNAHHGAEPTSMGGVYLKSALKNPWHVFVDGKEAPATFRFRGHRFESGQVSLLYSLTLADGRAFDISERPEGSVDAKGVWRLERTFKLGAAPANAGVLLDFESIELASQDNVKNIVRQPDSIRGQLALRNVGETQLVMAFPRPAMKSISSPTAAQSAAEAIIAGSDCASCHSSTSRAIGPSYMEIAARYKSNPQTLNGLTNKILQGGAGQWGQSYMIPHPTMKREDAAELARYILDGFDAADALGTETTHPLADASAASQDIAEEKPPITDPKILEAIRAAERRERMRLHSLHPSFTVKTIRPDSFKPLVGGMDFLPDRRLAVSTWDARGSVYIVGNLAAANPQDITVKEIASGLQEPLGLKVVDGSIYVMQKQELTKLVDLNGDEIIDEYRTVSDRWTTTTNWHEFTFGLEYREGYFYGATAIAVLSGGASAQPQAPDRGKVMRIDKETGEVKFIAAGLRVPNGIGVGTDNGLFITDNQGDWLPASKLLPVREGAFYGSHTVDAVGTQNLPITPPVVLIPQDEAGNSPSQPVRLDAGPYKNQMLVPDVRFGGLTRVVTQKVQGQYQGCVLPFTQGLEASVNRAIVGPDGAIYLGGVGNPGWSQPGKSWYGLQRLEYSGQPSFEILDIHSQADGLAITFTEPLRRGDGRKNSDYEVKQWRYEPTAKYGGPKIDERTLSVRAVKVSKDGRQVFLKIDGVEAGHVAYLRMTRPLRAKSDRALWTTESWCTVNALASKD